MSTSSNIVTIGSLIKKDLKKAYFLPQQPSSYSKGYRFLNETRYQVYDSPPPALSFSQRLYPFRNLPAAGDEVPVLLDNVPPSYLVEHWRKWLPAFDRAIIKSVDEGLQDGVPIVTTAAIECISSAKHCIHPDILYEVQLKSSILDVGVPCPRHDGSISFPFAVKVDMAWCGRGNQLVENECELSATLREIKDESGWTGRIVLQEFVPGVKQVPSFQFHLHKSGEIFWVGTTTGEFDGFEWTGATVDWDKQDHYRDLVYEDFAVPIIDYLKKRGYFGLVTFEVLFTDHGKYLVDLNPRVGGDTTHLLLARYMATEVGLKHSAMFTENTHKFTAQELIARAHNINNNNQGIVIILSVCEVDNGCCESDVSVFAETAKEVQGLYQKLAAEDDEEADAKL